MATLIRANGTIEEVHPKTGDSFTLEELQGYVHGYIECVGLPDGRVLVIDEEGKYKTPLVLNVEATRLGRLAGIADADFITGDAVVCTQREMGD